MPGRQAGQAVHRGGAQVEDRFPLRAALHRVWHLRQKMSLRCHQHHQSAEGPGEEYHAQVRAEQLQAAQAPDASSGTGPRTGRDERYRQIHCPQNSRGEDETQPGSVRWTSRLGGDSYPFPRVRPAELLHENPRGRHQGDHQASVRRPHPPRGARARRRHIEEEGRAQREGGVGLLQVGHRDGRADARPRPRRGCPERRGAPAVRHRGRGGPGVGCVHVRRAELVPRREAEAHGRPHDPPGARECRARLPAVCPGGRARPGGARLP
mmetsp:Transcript_29106/g.69306  ORF Transcript_29106/g.69306 Transcript_29106/m.69306 type:complete len:266 (-) Transcript_29106:1149-1946(-)